MEVAETTPALLTHCESVFMAMQAQSATTRIDDVDCQVWEGRGTKLFRDLGLSVPYYSTVMTALKGMDCVRQLERGGGGKPSRWLIVQPPSRELFKLLPDTSEKQQRETANQQQLNDLNRRIQRLERAVFDRDGSPLDRPA
jgi:hypothetical protein